MGGAYFTCLWWASNRPYTRRCARQHHTLLVDEHGRFCGTYILGIPRVTLFRHEKCLHPCSSARFSWRDRIGSAQLGREGLSQTHPLQQARQRRALCGLGTAATLLRRGSRRLQTAAQLIIYPDSDHRSHFQSPTSFCRMHAGRMFLDRWSKSVEEGLLRIRRY